MLAFDVPRHERQRGAIAALIALWLAIALPLSHTEPAGAATDPAPVATVLGTEVRTNDPEELRYLILGALTDRYAAERGIEVTSDEIDGYLARIAVVAERERLEQLRRDLDSGSATPQEATEEAQAFETPWLLLPPADGGK